MLGFTIKKTQEIEAAKAALANAEAKAASQAKKTRTATIIGGSTTAAAAIVAGITFFTGGRKINREKIKNYDLVVEERNKALHDAADSAAKAEHATNMAVAADGCCHKLATSIRTNNSAEMHAALKGHEAIHKALFNDITDESFNAAVAAYDAFVKSLESSQQQPQNPAPQQKKDPAPDTTKALEEAQRTYGQACAKAGAAKIVLDLAKAALDGAKSTDPNADAADLEEALAEAQANFDVANKELEDADKALKALQAQTQNQNTAQNQGQ